MNKGRRTHRDAVERRLAGAVAVVEQVLRPGLVDGDDRETELAVGLQSPHGSRLSSSPPCRRSRRRSGPAGRVKDPDHVGTVIHRDLRPMVDGRLEMLVVRLVVLALDRECRSRTRRRAQPRRRPGSRGDSTRRAPHRRRRLQRPHQVGGLARDVEARRDAMPSSGRSRSNRSRMAASTGICRSAHSILRTPSAERLRSFTS